jgi:hypothetical protein
MAGGLASDPKGSSPIDAGWWEWGDSLYKGVKFFGNAVKLGTKPGNFRMPSSFLLT